MSLGSPVVTGSFEARLPGDGHTSAPAKQVDPTVADGRLEVCDGMHSTFVMKKVKDPALRFAIGRATRRPDLVREFLLFRKKLEFHLFHQPSQVERGRTELVYSVRRQVELSKPGHIQRPESRIDKANQFAIK